jgi:hypothetical protein
MILIPFPKYGTFMPFLEVGAFRQDFNYMPILTDMRAVKGLGKVGAFHS